MSLDKVLYETQATVTGGREGIGRSEDGALSVTLTTPKELGGAGDAGTNPEQLFAVGYSACFLSALKAVARQEKVTLSDETSVTGTVGIGPIPAGFGLQVGLEVTAPGLDQAQAEELVAKAHKMCPYSNATRGNIDVTLSVKVA